MAATPLEDVVRNCDLRFDRIEQILPTLATKAELRAEIQAAIAPLARKADLELLATKAELEPLATKADLEWAIAPLATKAELEPLATRADLRAELQAEGAETRRFMKVLVDELRLEIRLTMEGLVDLDARDARQHADRLREHAGLDRRVTALEARRGRSRPR
jgi:hypothetical protein